MNMNQINRYSADIEAFLFSARLLDDICLQFFSII